MKIMVSCLLFAFTLVTIAGCNRPAEGPKPNTPAAADHGDVKANLAKLSAEDRKLAEEQKYCAIESENLLGSMGKPYKVMIKDQPVFLCCDGCETRAKAHAERTLAKVQQLKEANAKKTEDES
jgi:hypothetical protein